MMRVASVLSLTISLSSSLEIESNEEPPFFVYSVRGREPRDILPDQDTRVLFGLDNFGEFESVKEDSSVGELEDTVSQTAMEMLNAKPKERGEKSLLDTFPFNQQHHDHEGEHSDHHGDHHGHEEGHAHHDEHHAHHEAHERHEEHEDRGIVRTPFQENQIGFPSSQRRQQSEVDQSQPLLSRFPFDRVRSNDEEAGSGNEELEEDENDVTFNEVAEAAGAIAEAAASGRKCIDKVMMVQETVYDDVITCDHSYDKRCHTSYVTKYESQQQEECQENFRKNCYIEYSPVAYDETVEICRTPIVKDCNIEGETRCQTVYESECWTKQIVHEVEDDVTNCKTVLEKKCEQIVQGYTERNECDEWPREQCTIEKKKVKKYTPMTGCEKVPRELCAPSGCGFKNGTVICHDKVKTIVVEKPQEECSIEPVRTCKHVTKLVPKLVPVQECVDVPKEICARSKTNPRFIKKPVIKKWCYVPSEESGLA